MSARIKLAMKLVKDTKTALGLKDVARLLVEEYPKTSLKRLREAKEYPRGFRLLALSLKPSRLFEDKEALKNALISSLTKEYAPIKPYEALEVIREHIEDFVELSASLLTLSAEKLEEFSDVVAKLERHYSRISPRVRAIALLRPNVAIALAKTCKRKAFLDLALDLISRGFVESGAKILIDTLAETNDVEGLQLLLKLNIDKELVRLAFEKIIKDIEGLEAFLRSSGRTEEKLIKFLISLPSPPRADRTKEFVLAHRDLVREKVKESNTCPRYRINLAEKYEEEIIEEALTIPHPSHLCPISEAVKILKHKKGFINKLVEHYGCIVLKHALDVLGFDSTILGLAREKCRTVIPYIIDRLPEKIDDALYERLESIIGLAPPHYSAKVIEILVEKKAGSQDEEFVEKLISLSKKLGIEEEMPRFIAKIYGEVDEERLKILLNYDLGKLLSLLGEAKISPEAAYEILKRASEKRIYIPLNALIEASKLGVEDEKLKEIAERLPLHTLVSFEGRLAIKNRDLERRKEFLGKLSYYGLELSRKLLEELAEAYNRDYNYISFMFLLVARVEVKILLEELSKRLKRPDIEILRLIDEIIRNNIRPLQEAFTLLGAIFEGTSNPKVIERLRRIAVKGSLMPIEAFEALKAMKRIHPKVEEEERFFERFTPTLARASLVPGGKGAIEIMTNIFLGAERKISR